MNLPSRIEHHTHGGIFSVPNLGDDVCDFSSNVIPGRPSPRVSTALRLALADANKYPDPESTVMKKCLASYLHVPINSIAVGNGATEIIYRFCNFVLGKKSTVCMVNPTFSEYEIASSLAGHSIRKISCMNLKENLKIFSKLIPKNGCAFVCNPNNPTGELLEINDIEYLAKSAESKSSMLFVDESFIELVSGKNRSIATFAPKRKNLFVLRSLTKSFSIPGVRVGYCITNKKIADLLNRTSMPWNVSVFAQKAACAAVSSHKKHLLWAQRLVKTESEFLQKNINKINNYQCVANPRANFILVHTQMDSTILWKKMLKHKILVRNCVSFGPMCKNHIRIAVKTRTENKKLLEALKSI